MENLNNNYDQKYKINLIRLKKGCGSRANIIVEIDSSFYNLRNGEEIIVETSIKKSNTKLILKFEDGETKYYNFVFTGDGKDFIIEFSINFFQRVIVKSTKSTVCVF